MPPISLSTCIREKITLVKVMATHGKPKGSAGYEELLISVMTAILSAIKRSGTLTEDYATEVEELVKGVFSEAQVDTILQAMCNIPANEVIVPDDEKQVNDFMDVYQTEDGWRFFTSTEYGPEEKLQWMARVMLNMGLLSAHTRRSCAVSNAHTHFRPVDTSQIHQDAEGECAGVR